MQRFDVAQLSLQTLLNETKFRHQKGQSPISGKCIRKIIRLLLPPETLLASSRQHASICARMAEASARQLVNGEKNERHIHNLQIENGENLRTCVGKTVATEKFVLVESENVENLQVKKKWD